MGFGVETGSPGASPATGYLLALGPLLFISVCDVWLQLFSREQAYAINLAAVGTVAFGCTGRDLGRGRGAGRAPECPPCPSHPSPLRVPGAYYRR